VFCSSDFLSDSACSCMFMFMQFTDYSTVSLIGYLLQAFGVGAFENEDDDIYGVESMTNYDTVLGDEPQAGHRKNFGWTAPKHVSG